MIYFSISQTIIFKWFTVLGSNTWKTVQMKTKQTCSLWQLMMCGTVVCFLDDDSIEDGDKRVLQSPCGTIKPRMAGQSKITNFFFCI